VNAVVKKKSLIVIGLGYGDEGKGVTTDFLCSKSPKPIVIRFNGGQQAGHTVVTNQGKKHVFSNFGSGTFRGVPTFWSRYCTFSPAHFLTEYKKLNGQAILYLDKLCPITTHYDILYGRALETTRAAERYGSCGLGVGATIDRHEKTPHKLYVKDIFQSETVNASLQDIRSYYKEKIESDTKFRFDLFDHKKEDRRLKRCIKKLYDLAADGKVRIVEESDIFLENRIWDTYIFEGAQGILLDRNFGFRPYITKSNTTSKNAIEILNRYFEDDEIECEVYYVTRSYLTHHGRGPFLSNGVPSKLRNIKNETNRDNRYQGKFKITNLDIPLLNYSLNCDQNFSSNLKRNLVITCLDQLEDELITVFDGGNLEKVNYREITTLLNYDFERCFYSFSNCSDGIRD
jgi:adenylosuccinate synthase